MIEPARVEWIERRGNEGFYVVGDRSGGVWDFADRAFWELRWYPLKPSPPLVRRAEAILAGEPGPAESAPADTMSKGGR
jgi:hypothetical protein